MDLNLRIKSLSLLGQVLANRLKSREFEFVIKQAEQKNLFFTEPFVRYAFEKLIEKLDHQTLQNWIAPYISYFGSVDKTLAVIMAGNIPMVGFDDFLAGLLCGFRLKLKLSSKDDVLLNALIAELIKIEPKFSACISVVTDELTPFDALIATGSNQSSVYFEHYFAKYPHIIRKSRTSCAILNGNESDKDLALLADDIFFYFGLGCRSISKLYVPQGYSFEKLQAAFARYSYFEKHFPYQNNYDYQKSIKLINKEAFLEISPVLLVENTSFATPISLLHYEYYSSENAVLSKIEANRSRLQCVVGNLQGCIPFGKAQSPSLSDYADGVNTLDFLRGLQD